MSDDLPPLVLVVNDVESARYLIGRIVRSIGWRVEEAVSGFEGLAKAQALLPDVIVLDIRLPDLLGYEVCKRIKDGETTAGIAVIQTSATFVTPEGKARGLDSGADAYLTQPFEAIELVALLKSLLRLKRTETEARQKAAQLVEADKRKDEFLAMLGHELRNPLSAILTAAALIDRGQVDGDDMRRCNATILRQANNLARLVDDLLDVSRITQGKISLTKSVIDLRKIVDSVLAAQRSEIDRHHHRLVVDGGDAPLYVDGDATRLEQIVANLLGNAVKYTSDGGNIHVSLSEEPRDGGPRVVFRMRDTGVGLSKTDLRSIWDLFVQVDSSLARTAGGLGIGLTMVRRLVEMHGGTVNVTSDGIGQGSVFTFELPRAATAPAASALRRTNGAADAAARLRVLLVDDNLDSCELYKFALEAKGHDVTCAHDGQEGIDKALATPHDMAVIDIGLPTVDGYEVARTLRRELGDACPHLIALTGYGRPEDREQALAAGFDMHMVKPIDVASVEALFARVGRERRAAERPPP